MSLIDEMEFKKSEIEDKFFETQSRTPNDFIFWFDKLLLSNSLKESEFIIPKTQTLKISRQWWDYLRQLKYTDEVTKEFNEYLLSNFDLDEDKTYFIKNGTFSNKFNFKSCKLDDLNTFAEQVIEINYASFLVGAGGTTTIVVREYIESNSPHDIYIGMPLRNEIRYFYDFDKKKLLGYSKYWEEREINNINGNYLENESLEMFQNNFKGLSDEQLKEAMGGEIIYDLISYNRFLPNYTKEYNESKVPIGLKLSKALLDVELEGKWSVDIMVEDNKLYLIDMGKMEDSALTEYMEVFKNEI